MDGASDGTGALTTFLAILLVVNVVGLAVMTVLYRRAREASKERRVEAPNSEYKSSYVLDLEARERWERVDVARLHEVNREEFESLLARVRASSTRGLSESDRAFLDRMADAYERLVADDRSGRSTGSPRELPGTS